MYTAIEKKFAEALAKNSLVFTPSTQVREKLDSGVELVFTLAPALGQKPKAPAGATEQKLPSDPKQSPWLPADEALLVEKNETHSVILNKFALAKYHFLLVTNEFERQTSPLSPADWEQAMDLLRSVNKESGKRHIGFYNSGTQSGASVGHKHVQFMTLPDHFRPFPDTTPGVNPTEAVGDDRVPFAHYISGLKSDMTSEELAARYSDGLGRVLTIVSRSNLGKKRPEVNYNLVFTEEWMILTPRRAESTGDGISLNALATIGLMLAKNDEQLAYLKDKALDAVLDVGFPFEEVRTLPPSHTGYTHY